MSIGTTHASGDQQSGISARVLQRIAADEDSREDREHGHDGGPGALSAVARCCGSFSRVMTITTATTTIAPSARMTGTFMGCLLRMNGT